MSKLCGAFSVLCSPIRSADHCHHSLSARLSLASWQVSTKKNDIACPICFVLFVAGDFFPQLQNYGCVISFFFHFCYRIAGVLIPSVFVDYTVANDLFFSGHTGIERTKKEKKRKIPLFCLNRDGVDFVHGILPA